MVPFRSATRVAPYGFGLLLRVSRPGDSGVNDEPSLWESSQCVPPMALMRHFRAGTTNGWTVVFGLCLGTDETRRSHSKVRFLSIKATSFFSRPSGRLAKLE